MSYQIGCSVVLYNTDTALVKTITDCLLTCGADLKIYLVDNSPVNNYAGAFDGYQNIEYIFNNNNLGYGAGHNIGIRRSIADGAKYHLVVNPDIIFEPQIMKELLSFMNNNPDIAHVMPKVFYPDGSVQHVCKLLPSPIDLIFKRFLPKRLYEKRAYKFQLKFTNYDKIMDVPYLSGCFMFLRTSILQQVGLFDERFFMYPEDIDLTRRIHKVSRTVFYPHVSVVHQHAAESYFNRKLLQIHITNMIKYFNKWGWIIDRERNAVNQTILKKLGYNE